MSSSEVSKFANAVKPSH